MDFRGKIDAILQDINNSGRRASLGVERVRGQLEFASAFAELHPQQKDEWHDLILRAAELVRGRLPSTAPIDLAGLVSEAEEILAPIGPLAKTYTIHCCGHAHIDMNWTWPLLETVATAHDTYTTLDRLMDLFPDLKFGQSQISIYKMMKQVLPRGLGDDPTPYLRGSLAGDGRLVGGG